MLIGQRELSEDDLRCQRGASEGRFLQLLLLSSLWQCSIQECWWGSPPRGIWLRGHHLPQTPPVAPPATPPFIPHLLRSSLASYCGVFARESSPLAVSIFLHVVSLPLCSTGWASRQPSALSSNSGVPANHSRAPTNVFRFSCDTEHLRFCELNQVSDHHTGPLLIYCFRNCAERTSCFSRSLVNK